MNLYDSSKLPSAIINFIVRFFKIYYNFKFELFNRRASNLENFKDYQKTRPMGKKRIFCFAPYKNLYFGVDGKVVSCCLNRYDCLGNYPKQSIKQIWGGNQIKSLRNLFRQNEIPKGCFLCQDRIESRNFDAVDARIFDVIHAKKNYPVMMEFELSNSCNLECIMCSSYNSSMKAKNSKHEIGITHIYDDNFVNQLEEFIPHLKRVKFLGGEPFLIPIYYKIWDKFIKLNPDCIMLIQTNGTVLNDNIKRLIDKGNFRIGLSIDSFSKKTYETIRINSVFENVMQNLAYFREHALKNDYTFSVSICPMQQNWKELPEMVTFCNNKNIIVYFNTVINPVECSLYYLSVKRLKEVHLHMVTAALSNKTNTEKKNYIHFNDFIKQIEAWIKQKEAAAKSWNYEKQILDKKTMQELIGEIDRILLEYYKERPELTNDYLTIKEFSDNYQKATLHFIDDYCFKRSVYRLSLQPIEIIIYELIRLSKENMSELLEKIILKSKGEEQSVMADME